MSARDGPQGTALPGRNYRDRMPTGATRDTFIALYLPGLQWRTAIHARELDYAICRRFLPVSPHVITQRYIADMGKQPALHGLLLPNRFRYAARTPRVVPVAIRPRGPEPGSHYACHHYSTRRFPDFNESVTLCLLATYNKQNQYVDSYDRWRSVARGNSAVVNIGTRVLPDAAALMRLGRPV